MLKNWAVTYQIVTQESAEEGDIAEDGFLVENVSLREAVSEFGCTADSADCWPIDCGIRWLQTHAEEDYRTGNETTNYLHIPNQITGASRLRLARLLGLKV